MNLIKNNKNEIFILILSLLISTLINSGYHWQDYNYLHSLNFKDSISEYKNLAGYHLYFRPFMFLHIRLIDFLNKSEFYFNSFNSLSWIISVFLFYYSFKIKKYVNEYFLLISLFPSISSSIVLSGLFTSLSHALIFFSISALFLQIYLHKKKIIYLIFFNIFLIISLLFYEIVFIFSPFYFLLTENKKVYLKIFFNLIIIVLIYIFYNKFIIEAILQPDSMDTRIRMLNFEIIPIFISNFTIMLRIVFLDIPQMFFNSLVSSFSNLNIKFIIFLFLIIILLFFIKNKQYKKNIYINKFVIVIFSSLIFNIGILSITNFPPFMFGNYNRGIVGLLFFIACFLPLLNKNSIGKFAISLFVFLNIISFINIKQNSENIEKFKHRFIKTIKTKHDLQNIIILPIGHKFNTNGEEIYETENDFKSYFYGMSFFDFYNNKYNYNLNTNNLFFLLPTRACNIREYKVSASSQSVNGIFYPINIYIYDKNLNYKSIIVNNHQEFYNFAKTNLDCEYSESINHYYSQSYVLSPFCVNYFNMKNNIKKFICKNIISSYYNYSKFSSKL